MPLYGHFYYSEKQKERIKFSSKLLGIPKTTCFCELEEDGQILEYTEMCDHKKNSYFDDGEYLGYGCVHSVNGVRQS